MRRIVQNRAVRRVRRVIKKRAVRRVRAARTRSGLVDIAENMRHAGLVPHEGSQVAGLRLVIFRERLHLATEAACALLRQKAQRAVTRTLELAVRPDDRASTASQRRACQSANVRDRVYPIAQVMAMERQALGI